MLSTWWMCPLLIPKCRSISTGGKEKVSTTNSDVPVERNGHFKPCTELALNRHVKAGCESRCARKQTE